MKVKVLESFIDAHSKKIHKEGDELDISAERFAEIEKAQKGLVKKVQIAPKKDETKKDKIER